MQNGVQPLEEKLAKDGAKSYTAQSAMLALKEKIAGISVDDLAVDLLPMFENATFIESWLENFHANFGRFADSYMRA
jgi:hypothetical protein